MPKNVVLCCDGTANEFAQNRTNVVKLFSALVHDPTQQVVYYHPGVGTMEPPGALTKASRGFTKILGMAIGYGLEADIRDAYVFLMNHFAEGDRVFLLGFSRGAYTVRAVTALLHMYGLIDPGNEPLVPYAIRMMMAITNIQKQKSQGASRYASLLDGYFGLASDFKNQMGRQGCNPYFVGVWDTVSSVGWLENPVRLPFTANNPDIAIGRHAIAIDERRAFFRTNLWRPSADGGPKDLKQVWFPGVHCDVGGGYPEPDSGLSKCALQWMYQEASAAGLITDPKRIALVLGQAGEAYAPPDPNAKMHESLTRWWRIAEFIPKRHYNWTKGKEERRMNLFRRRTILDGSLVYESAYLRANNYADRLPASAVRAN